MTTSQAIISKIKHELNVEFDKLTFEEYENLCYGDGTLAVLDKVLSNYEHIDFTDDEAATLAEYCTQRSNDFGRMIQRYKISRDLADTIRRAFVEDQRGIARFNYWLEVYELYAQPDDSEHVDNYHQLLLELMAQRNLDVDELDEYTNGYASWLLQQMDSIMDGFGEVCANGTYNIDDRDDWLAWLNGFDECTYQDMKYIDMYWDDAAKIKYKRHTEHFKCYNINQETGEVINETDYCGTYEDALKQFVEKTVRIYKHDED